MDVSVNDGSSFSPPANFRDDRALLAAVTDNRHGRRKLSPIIALGDRGQSRRRLGLALSQFSDLSLFRFPAQGQKGQRMSTMKQHAVIGRRSSGSRGLGRGLPRADSRCAAAKAVAEFKLHGLQAKL